MIRLIFSIVFLVILAVFIALNARFTTDVNLFGYRLESIPVVAVVLLTLVVGVLYSFGLYLITFFSRRRADKLKDRKRENEEKEKILKTQEQKLKTAQASLKQSTEDSAQPGEESPERKSGNRPSVKKTKKKAGFLKSLARKAGLGSR